MRKNGAFKYIRPRTYITVAFALLLVFLAVTNYWVLSNDKIPLYMMLMSAIQAVASTTSTLRKVFSLII